MTYWIGDRVWISSLHKEGTFEGERAEMAVVKVDGTQQLFHFRELTLLTEEDDTDLDILDEAGDREPVPFALWDHEIDLHIDVLNPALRYAEPVQILAHQISRMKDFVTRALERKTREIVIIHGKGAGVLKAEVLLYLKGLPEVREMRETGGGGALKILFHLRN